MPKFFYFARDKIGKSLNGSEEAMDKDELIARLQSRGLFVINVLPELGADSKGSSAFSGGLERKGKIKYHSRVTAKDLALFCRQLATLLGAGVTIAKSIEIISQQVNSRRLYKALLEVQKNMERGLSLHEAMLKRKDVFSELWVNLVESGEAGGSLAVVLNRLAAYLERNENFKNKIISAMIYPCILLVAGTAALLFLTIKIIPTFAELFTSFDIKLPALTQMLLTFSMLLRRYSLVIIGLLVGTGILLRKIIQTRAGRRRYERFQFSLPVFGEFFRALIVERFSSNMATLLESGVPILYAMEITERSVANLIVAEVIHEVKEQVRQGKPLSRPLSASGFFEPMVIQMITVGEEIGELPQMFKKINAFYQDYVETFLARFTSMFEPFMLVFIGGVIGIMIVGMFWPIFQIAQIGR